MEGHIVQGQGQGLDPQKVKTKDLIFKVKAKTKDMINEAKARAIQNISVAIIRSYCKQ